MFPMRQRAVRLAQRVRVARGRQPYSSSHGHDHAHHEHAAPANESFGPGIFFFAASLPAAIALYKVSQPGADGTAPALTRFIQKYMSMGDMWAERNAGHVAAVEEAGRDRMLWFHQPKPDHYDIRSPEVLFAGSQRCVPPSMNVNLDKVVEHYRTKHLEDEERKFKALSAAAATKQ